MGYNMKQGGGMTESELTYEEPSEIQARLKQGQMVIAPAHNSNGIWLYIPRGVVEQVTRRWIYQQAGVSYGQALEQHPLETFNFEHSIVLQLPPVATLPDPRLQRLKEMIATTYAGPSQKRPEKETPVPTLPTDSPQLAKSHKRRRRYGVEISRTIGRPKKVIPLDSEGHEVEPEESPPPPIRQDDVHYRILSNETRLYIRDKVLVEIGKKKIQELVERVYSLDVIKEFEKEHGGIWSKDMDGAVLILPPAPESSRPGFRNAVLVEKLKRIIFRAYHP